MNNHLPDYRSKEDGVLYIIGNGFDLYHGLHTKYMDFHDWLMKDHSDFVSKMNIIYPKIKDGELELWKDFEKALGDNEDCDKLHKIFGNDRLSSHPSEQQQTSAAALIKETLDQICPLLKKWACTFHDEYDKVKEILPLGKGSKYITFNYTNTLEEVYHIEGDDTVLHIHGRADNEDIITGFEKSREEFPMGTALEVVSQENIKRELERFRKPTASVYTKHDEFFSKLTNINTIVIIGHSLADVDIPYFKFLLQTFPDNVDIKWQYWIHNKEAEVKARNRIGELCNEWFDFENKMAESRWSYLILDVNKYLKKNGVPSEHTPKRLRLEEAIKKGIELGIIG